MCIVGGGDGLFVCLVVVFVVVCFGQSHSQAITVSVAAHAIYTHFFSNHTHS